jgi:DNA-binding MarR family transcriptional regulator
MNEVERPIEYDRQGRMKYHPDYHHNHNKPYTMKELSYICKHYKRGQVKSLALALGRTEHSIRVLVNKLRRDGLFEQYKNMGD